MFLMDQYKKEVLNIKEYAVKNDISEDQITKVFKECFNELETRNSKTKTITSRLLKFKILLLSIASILFLYNHPKTHNIFLRNLQNYIYPGLRVFRKLTVPIITVSPSLTEWYDEWCLIENPYFQVNEMDCWPCSTANSVQDLTNYNISPTFNTGNSFIRTEKSEKVDMNKLFQTYIKYQDIFDTHAERVISNQEYYKTIRDVMYRRLDINPFTYVNTHIKWKVNRMEPGRKLRKLFPKLPGIPDWWNPSTEKFIFIDEPKSIGYDLPSPECSNVIMQCSSGERLIQLNPSPECTQKCQKLSIILKAGQSLWYNWWYWRPMSLPSNNTTAITINYLSSYC